MKRWIVMGAIVLGTGLTAGLMAPRSYAADKPQTLATSDEVSLTANDTMRFSTDHIEVAAGKPVKITLKNVGVVPKIAMGHNLVVLKPGEDPVKFGGEALQSGTATPATDYIPTKADLKDKILAHTKLLGPGESDTITYTFEKGEYPFLCLFPGHYVQMHGVIVAK